MEELDLSGINPIRWPEVRRRVALVTEYDAIDMPTRETTERYAADMGLSVTSFYRIFAAWRAHRDPQRIFGSRGIGPQRRARNETRDLPEGTRALIASAIEETGVWSRDRDILKAVQAKLAAAGLHAAAPASVRLALLQTRSATTATADLPTAILIEDCRLKLPFADGDGVTMPIVMLAVATPENRVIAYRIGTDAAPPSAIAIVDDLVAMTTHGAEARPLVGPRLPTDILESLPLPVDRSSRRLRLRLVFGSDIGGIGFVTQAMKATPAASLRRGHLDHALDRADIDTAIAAAIERHNVGRPALPPFSLAGAQAT